MSASWPRISLGALTERRPICYGVLKPGERQPSGVPLLRITDLAGDKVDESSLYLITPELSAEFKRSILSGGEVLLSIQGTIGRVAICPPHLAGANISRTLALIAPDDRIDREFLRYWLLSLDGTFPAGGSTRDSLNIGAIRELEAPVPQLSEQRRIVAILGEAFEGIAAAKANAEKNLQNARALFAQHRDDLFCKGRQSWRCHALGDLADVQSGGTPLVSTKEFWGGNIAWYSSGELNDVVTKEPERFITETGLASSNAKLFPKGSLLIGMYDTAALKMSMLDRDAAFNQAIAGVKPNPNVDLEFILHAINADKPAILQLRRGVRQKNLSLGKIKDIVLPIPGTSVQRQTVSQLRAVREQSERLEDVYLRKVAALDELKKALLYQAFAGKLTEQSPDEQVPEVA
jgi:type I restriction enzyme S subunit